MFIQLQAHTSFLCTLIIIKLRVLSQQCWVGSWCWVWEWPHTHIYTHTVYRSSSFIIRWVHEKEELEQCFLYSHVSLVSFTGPFTAFSIRPGLRSPNFSDVSPAEFSHDLRPPSQKPLQVGLIRVYSLARPIRPFCLRSQQCPHSKSEAARRLANLAHIKAFSTLIISVSHWYFNDLISSLAHKQFTEFTATTDTNNRGK